LYAKMGRTAAAGIHRHHGKFRAVLAVGQSSACVSLPCVTAVR
jgi:hypothetical protein